jgi:hypothetical protein
MSTTRRDPKPTKSRLIATPEGERFRRIKVPTAGHAAVRRLFEEMNTQRVSTTALAAEVGMSINTFKDWRVGRTCPTVVNFEAALNALGLELAVQPIIEEPTP